MRLAIAGGCLALTLVIGSMASAREPGVGPSIPPGVTAGQANAVPLTPGFRVASLASYYDACVRGGPRLPSDRAALSSFPTRPSWWPGAVRPDHP